MADGAGMHDDDFEEFLDGAKEFVKVVTRYYEGLEQVDDETGSTDDAYLGPVTEERVEEDAEELVSQMERAIDEYGQATSGETLEEQERRNYMQAMKNVGKAVNYIYAAEENPEEDVSDTVKELRDRMETFLAQR